MRVRVRYLHSYSYLYLYRARVKVVQAVFVIFQKAVSEDLLMQIDSIVIVVPESIKMVSLTAFYPLRILAVYRP